MKDKAFAKINLSLDVVGKREDGYHELCSIMIPLNFYDELFITKDEKMSYSCNKHFVIFNENNTIVKAVELMKSRYNIKDNFKVHLNKHIPIKAGLAGGSSDGASVIRIINKMYKLNLSKDEIKELCLQIGADTLFTYYNKPALVRGVGEELDFFHIKNNYYILIIKPYGGVSTKDAFERLDLNNCDHPDILDLKGKLENGESFKGLLGNSLEAPSEIILPEIKEIKDQLKELGLTDYLMSGSGSTVFAIDEDLNRLKKVEEHFNAHYFTRVCSIIL